MGLSTTINCMHLAYYQETTLSFDGKGERIHLWGRKASDKYVGGCMVVDSMSSFLHVEHQSGVSGPETIYAKQLFEHLTLDHGVLINS